MAKNKKTTARITADRAAQLRASSVRAGKGKGSTIERMRQNKGVKHGTVRRGKAGKSYNVYDAKTGTWKKGKVVGGATSKPTPPASAPKMSSKNTKFITDRLTNPLPHKGGYKSLGAEGNKRLQPRKNAPRPKSSGLKPLTSSYFKQGGGGLYSWLRGR